MQEESLQSAVGPQDAGCPSWGTTSGCTGEEKMVNGSASACGISILGLHCLESQAESQEILNYIPDSAINFVYGLGQLVSPASLGFSLDKVGKIVSITDL